MSDVNWNMLLGLISTNVIGTWVKENYLAKADAEKMMASKIRITFGADFVGQTYTVTGAGETYTGVVPDTLTAELTITSLDTVYTVTCMAEDGKSYERSVHVGNYYGIYPLEFVSFMAYLVVTADPGATITVTGSNRTYTGQTDVAGLVELTIGAADTYEVTATLDGHTTKPVTVVIENEGTVYNCKCPTLLYTIVSWTDGTDEELAAMLDAAKAGRIDLQTDGGWAVGDVRTITVGAFTGGGSVYHGSQSVDIVITSFEDYNECGAIMQFDFKDALSEGNGMNSTDTNAGGYKASTMYTTTLPNMANALPEWLSSRLVEFAVNASNGTSTIETVTGNKLALRSEIEIFGSVTYGRNEGGSRVEYYATTSNRVKKRGHSGSANSWWLRSAYAGSSAYFCFVGSSGSVSYYTAGSANGVAPFGCI